jgi:hypothetical protein
MHKGKPTTEIPDAPADKKSESTSERNNQFDIRMVFIKKKYVDSFYAKNLEQSLTGNAEN